MSVMEIVLLVIGAAIFILSFLIPERGGKLAETISIDEDAVKNMADQQVQDAKGKIEDIVDETVQYAVEKTERNLDKLTNEKIMAVNEYSDTVLEEINKNHKEVMFLYDMLNNKSVDLKNTVRKAEQTKKETIEIKEQINKEAIEIREQQDAIKQQEAVKQQDMRNSAVVFPDENKLVQEKPKRQKKQAEEAAVPAFQSGLAGKKVSKKNSKILATEPSNGPLTETSSGASTGTSAEFYSEHSKEVSIQFTPGQDDGKNKNDKILELHKAGKSNVAIAKELNLGVGEVKLVIDLFEGGAARS